MANEKAGSGTLPSGTRIQAACWYTSLGEFTSAIERIGYHNGVPLGDVSERANREQSFVAEYHVSYQSLISVSNLFSCLGRPRLLAAQ
jgi:hypothetical protein